MIAMFLSLLLFSLAATGQEIGDLCPPYDQLYPCFCNFMPKYDAPAECYHHHRQSSDPFPDIVDPNCRSSVITCVGHGITELAQILAKIARHNRVRGDTGHVFDWFYLVDTGRTALENGLFDQLPIRNIFLQNCPRLTVIEEHAFGNESRLFVNNIYINATMLSDHPRTRRKTFKALSSLKNLHVLEIQSSNIVTIPFKAFNKFTDVQIIRFNNPDVRQKLAKISSKSFYRASKLAEIDLKNNRISRIAQHAFAFQRVAYHEVKLFLSGNHLHSDSFEPAAFDGGNGRHMTLYLGDYHGCNQRLVTLKRQVFESFLLENNLNIIDMYGCPLVCDHQMDWLTNGDRFRNQIRNLVCYNQSEMINTDDRYEFYHVTQE